MRVSTRAMLWTFAEAAVDPMICSASMTAKGVCPWPRDLLCPRGATSTRRVPSPQTQAAAVATSLRGSRAGRLQHLHLRLRPLLNGVADKHRDDATG